MDTRAESLALAQRYARQAARLAHDAQEKNHSDSQRHLVAELTAVGALYADISRTYAAIAQVTPADATAEEK